VNKPVLTSRLQSCFRPIPQTTAQSSYQYQSIWAFLTHSDFPFFYFFSFFYFNFFSSFFSVLLLLLCFSLSSFPSPFLVFLPPPTTSPGRKKKKVLSASRWPKWLPSTKKANWAPGPCANFQEISMESMPVLPFEESCPNTLTATTKPKQQNELFVCQGTGVQNAIGVGASS
jgi:hypothetical protein